MVCLVVVWPPYLLADDRTSPATCPYVIGDGTQDFDLVGVTDYDEGGIEAMLLYGMTYEYVPASGSQAIVIFQDYDHTILWQVRYDRPLINTEATAHSEVQYAKTSIDDKLLVAGMAWELTPTVQNSEIFVLKIEPLDGSLIRAHKLDGFTEAYIIGMEFFPNDPQDYYLFWQMVDGTPSYSNEVGYPLFTRFDGPTGAISPQLLYGCPTYPSCSETFTLLKAG